MSLEKESTPFLKNVRIVLPIVLLVSGLFLPAGATAADRGITFDREADFSKYKTYEWVAAKPKSPKGSPLALGGEADTLIRNAIDRELGNQGFTQAIDQKSDFLVTFDGALEPVTDIEGQRRQLAQGVAWVVDGSINSYQRGTLVITITDRKTQKPVWSAWTTDKVKNPDKPQKQLDKAVKKLLRKFPPKVQSAKK